jgi:hypothetical protein
MEITLTLPGHRIPSQNLTRKMHWAKRSKLRKDDEWSLTAAKLDAQRRGQKVWPKPGEHVSVHVHSYRARLLDNGNLIGGAKGLLDALVNVGLATDDRAADMTDTYQQTKVPGAEQRTEITITWDPV